MENSDKSCRRFFLNNFHKTQNLDYKLMHRLFNVLRFKLDEELEFTDGAGNVYRAKVIKIDFKKPLKLNKENMQYNFCDYFEILKEYKELRNPFNISVAVSIFRPEYFKFMVQKAVELGASKIIPITSDYTRKYNDNYLSKFKDKNQEIADQALSQCKRAYRLRVTDIVDISKLDTSNYNNIMVFHPGGKDLRPSDLKEKNMLLLFGPEGGFSEKDLTYLKDYNTYKLTKYLLRTETAVIYVLSSIDSLSKLNLN